MNSKDDRVRDRCVAPLGIALLLVLAVRLATLGAYPLTDTTEARYGEIARVMLTTGDWITPQLEPGLPFWGKPPLYAWLTASSFGLLGVNEFAARLPQFLLCIGVLWLMAAMTTHGHRRSSSRLAQLIFASSVIGFVASGAVMTDMALVLGTTMAMVGFWRFQQSDCPRWAAVFFLGVAIGLLAKGPVALVLTGLPLFIWLIAYGRWRAVLSMRPVTGLAIIAAVAGPWYLAAELKTPGFLSYFLWGEHVLRFIQPGWSGDLYGTAHDRTRGTIWLYWLIAALPWTPILVASLWRRWRTRQLGDFFFRSPDGAWHGYLLCWMISPMLFFTFAGNILPAYVLPGMPAFALLLAALLARSPTAATARRRVTIAAAVAFAPLTFLLLLTAYASGHLSIRTEKATIAAFEEETDKEDIPLFYFDGRPMSAAFYSRGHAQRLTDWSKSPITVDEFWVAARGNEVVPIRGCETAATSQRYTLHRCIRPATE